MDIFSWLMGRGAGGGSGGGDSSAGIDALIDRTISGEIVSGVATVGNYAFGGCTNLTSVNLPMAKKIGEYAFTGCFNIASVNLPMAEEIGQKAFYAGTNLASVNLPMAEEIGQNAFQGCKNLTSVTTPKVKIVMNEAFLNCGEFEVGFPEATELRGSAFSSSKITSAIFPKVHTTQGGVFQYCRQLETVSLPLVTEIVNNTFNYCDVLTRVDIPSAKTIGVSFQNCLELSYLDLPSAESISNSAFTGSKKLSTIVLRNPAKVCTLGGSIAFTYTQFSSDTGYTGGKLLVPAALVESYKTATNWSVLWSNSRNKLLALEDYTVDGTVTGEIDWDKLNAV